MVGRVLVRGLNVGLVAIGALAGTASVSAAQSTPGTATFSKDVAPIFQSRCQSCHQPNSIAPMSL